MNCQRFEIAIHEYYRGTLAADEQRAVELHAVACATCAGLKARCEELPCRELVEVLDGYLQGILAEDRCAVLDRHLELCSDCRAYLEAYRRTVQLCTGALGTALPAALPPLPEELVRAILEALR